MLIDSQLIVREKNFPDCEAAIRYGGSILYRLGYVKDTYTDSVLAREKLFPTGLPTQPVPIAIPHTGSEHVNRSMFYMIVFDNPVMFRQMGSEEERIPAEIMLLLAIDGMESKKVLICCANGVATSTFVAMKCKNKFKEMGITAEVSTCTSLEVKSKAQRMKPDLIISNVGKSIKVPEGIPVVYGVNLLSGREMDATWDEILEHLNK